MIHLLLLATPLLPFGSYNTASAILFLLQGLLNTASGYSSSLSAPATLLPAPTLPAFGFTVIILTNTAKNLQLLVIGILFLRFNLPPLDGKYRFRCSSAFGSSNTSSGSYSIHLWL